MRGFFCILIACFLCAWAASAAQAAPAQPTQPTVKDVALAFGNALVKNDGGTAISLLAPDLRSHTAADQLPAMLNVTSPPQRVHVVRWAFDGADGDATLSLFYPGGVQVAERLVMHLYAVGWRIVSIVPEDALALQRAAETTVAAFCDAALRRDFPTMREELTAKLAAHRSNTDIMKLLAVSEPLSGYSIESYGGTPAGADVVVKLQTTGGAELDDFVVINDRDGWRIAAVHALSR